MRIDLRTMKLFIAIYEEQSIAKAAEREHIAPSALSKRLSDLEEELRVVLFHRTRNGLEPTPVAYALLHHARLVMRDVAQMESELADYAKGLKGHIRIYSNIWAIIQYLPEDLASFLELHPLVRVDLEESISPAIIQAVAENAADIGILASNVVAPGLQTRPYRRDPLVAVMPPGHDLSARKSVRFAEMLGYDLVGGKRGSAIDSLVNRAAAELGQTIRRRINVSGFETVCRMAEANLGIGLVPAQSAERYLSAMRIVAVPLDEPWAMRQLNLCFAASQTLPPATRQLVEHLAGQAQT